LCVLWSLLYRFSSTLWGIKKTIYVLLVLHVYPTTSFLQRVILPISKHDVPQLKGTFNIVNYNTQISTCIIYLMFGTFIECQIIRAQFGANLLGSLAFVRMFFHVCLVAATGHRPLHG
ncbi:hypothetical protein ACJX0J_017033, partial [Zea mays]